MKIIIIHCSPQNQDFDMSYQSETQDKWGLKGGHLFGKSHNRRISQKLKEQKWFHISFFFFFLAGGKRKDETDKNSQDIKGEELTVNSSDMMDTVYRGDETWHSSSNDLPVFAVVM